MIGINVVVNTDITDAILADLGTHGMVPDVIREIRAVTLQARSGELGAIRALPYVAAANPDARRNGEPVDTVMEENFSDGLSTWDQDAINVTDFGKGRTVAFDGSGVYVAVLDTGLLGSETTNGGGGHPGAAGITGIGDVEAILNICAKKAMKVLKKLSSSRD